MSTRSPRQILRAAADRSTSSGIHLSSTPSAPVMSEDIVMSDIERCSITSLPPELILPICAELGQGDLLSLARTCRRFSAMAICQLYRSPEVRGAFGWTSLCATLSRRHELANRIVRLHYRFAVLGPFVQSTHSLFFAAREATPFFAQRKAMHPVLPACAELCISFRADGDASDKDFGSVTEFVGLFCPRISELVIVNLSEVGDLSHRPEGLQGLDIIDHRLLFEGLGPILGFLNPLQALIFRRPFTPLFLEEFDAICSAGRHLQQLVLHHLGVFEGESLGSRLPALKRLGIAAYSINDRAFCGPMPHLTFLGLSLSSAEPSVGDAEALLQSVLDSVQNGYMPRLECLDVRLGIPDDQSLRLIVRELVLLAKRKGFLFCWGESWHQDESWTPFRQWGDAIHSTPPG